MSSSRRLTIMLLHSFPFLAVFRFFFISQTCPLFHVFEKFCSLPTLCSFACPLPVIIKFPKPSILITHPRMHSVFFTYCILLYICFSFATKGLCCILYHSMTCASLNVKTTFLSRKLSTCQ